MIRVAAAVVLLALVGVAGCGDDEPASVGPVQPPPHWRTRHDLLASLRPSSAKAESEYFPAMLPQVRLARMDDGEGHGLERTEWPRVVLSGSHDRRIYFKRYEFDFKTHQDETAGVLCEALGDYYAADDLRDPHGACLVPVLLHFDREVPWGDLCRILAVCVDPPLRMERIQFAVQSVRYREYRRVDLRVTPSGPPTPGAHIALRLARKEKATVVTVGKRTLVFPPGDRFDDEGFVRRANETWSAIEAHLPTVSNTRPVHLRTNTATEVPWAYVVKIFDLLASRGVRTVHLPDVAKQIEILPTPPGP